MIQVKRKGRELELMIQDRQKRIEEINHSRKQTKVGSKKLRKGIQSGFTT
ncbi:hypothetical protein PAMP_015894 [Pampus punctatissimus]